MLAERLSPLAAQNERLSRLAYPHTDVFLIVFSLARYRVRVRVGVGVRVTVSVSVRVRVTFSLAR